MADRNDERSSPRGGRGSGAPLFADFLSFREIMREEPEAARAEREVAAAEARVEREIAAAEQRRLMAEVYELKLQLAEERRSRPGVVQSGTAAVQSGTTAGGERITNSGGIAIGLDGRMHIKPMRWMGREYAPSPTRSQASTSSRVCGPCPQVVKEDDNLAISDGDRLSTGDELDGMRRYFQSQYVLDALFSVSGGKLFDPDSGLSKGIGCEVGKLDSWISDDGASRQMTSSHNSMTNHRECSGFVRTAGGDVLPIEGVGDILLRFLSDSGAFDIELLNVAFVPQLSHNLLPLQQFTASHHTYFGTKNGAELQFKSGQTLQARKFGRTNVLRGYRMAPNGDKAFRATIAPRVKPPILTWMLTSTTFPIRSVMFMRDFCARRQSSEISV